jgi:hypothetical protein
MLHWALPRKQKVASMGLQPERFTLTLTNYGRRLVLDVKRGQVKLSRNEKRITVDFPENVTRKPKNWLPERRTRKRPTDLSVLEQHQHPSFKVEEQMRVDVGSA